MLIVPHDWVWFEIIRHWEPVSAELWLQSNERSSGSLIHDGDTLIFAICKEYESGSLCHVSGVEVINIHTTGVTRAPGSPSCSLLVAS